MTAPGTRIVITGASSGIGQATALAFARTGARLVLAARGLAALERVADQCRAAGGEAMVIQTDVTDSGAVRSLADRARSAYGGIDLWFSNVGVGAVGKFQDVPIEAHQQTIRANLIGHMNDAYAVLPIFLRQGYGTFVNMISLAGFSPAPFAAAYSASKFGLRGLSEALRAELSDYPDIHVCDVYPAFVDTPGLHHGANYIGRRLTAPPPLIDARRVADAVVRLVDHPRNTVMLGSPTPASRLMHAFSPELNARIIYEGFRRYFETAEPVPVSEGNLFAPPAEPGGIDGGLRSPPQRTAAALVAGGAALATAATGIGLLLRRRAAGRRQDGGAGRTGRP
jgi:short-subunit dehydrogenase